MDNDSLQIEQLKGHKKVTGDDGVERTVEYDIAGLTPEYAVYDSNNVRLETKLQNMQTTIGQKSDKTYVDQQLATKASASDVEEVQTKLDGKVDASGNDNVAIKRGDFGVYVNESLVQIQRTHTERVGSHVVRQTSYVGINNNGEVEIQGEAKLNDKQIATTDQIPNVSGKADKTYVDTELAKCIKGNESGEYILPNDTNYIGADPNSYEETTEYASFGENGVAIVSGDHDVRILAESGSIEMVSQNGATLNDKQIATTDQIPDVSGKADKTDLGTLSELTTTDKSSAVSAINEISSEITDLQSGKMANTQSGDPCHYLYVEAGATWNASTNYWELNGLTDITTEQMRKIYTESIGRKPQITSWVGVFSKCTARTIFPWGEGFQAAALYYGGQAVSLSCFAYASNIEVLYIPNDASYLTASSMYASFCKCSKLVNIMNYINVANISSYTNTFAYSPLLERVHLYKLKANVSFNDSPNLANESILYMINNATNTSAITITLHATAYARATADADIVAAAAAHNITLASA